MLHLTAELDAKLKRIVDFNPDEQWSEDHPELYDFTSYVRLIADFANNDLSAFYFDIRKDVLYCDVNALTGAQSDRRRAYRTVLDTLFHALVRWLAPVLVFTTEEVWGTRFPDAGSVHLLEWPEVRPIEVDAARWAELRALRTQTTEAIEPLRREKVLGSSLEAEVTVPSDADPALLQELFISSTVHVGDWKVVKTANHKCGRCWRHLPEVAADGDLCKRCEDVVNG
jgi:isoleucyl-tRNA synthetase